MIKRLINFNTKDWKHLGWLFKGLCKNFITCNYADFMECYYLIRLHLCHDNKII